MNANPSEALALLDEAVGRLSEVFGDGMFAMQAGGHFTCSEAEIVADVLRAGGHDAAARVWLAGHGQGDDGEDDMHSLGTDESDLHHGASDG